MATDYIQVDENKELRTQKAFFLNRKIVSLLNMNAILLCLYTKTCTSSDAYQEINCIFVQTDVRKNTNESNN